MSKTQNKLVEHNRLIASVKRFVRDRLDIDLSNMSVDVFDLEKREDSLIFDCIMMLFGIKMVTGRAKAYRFNDPIYGDVHIFVISPIHDEYGKLRVAVLIGKYAVYFS